MHRRLFSAAVILGLLLGLACVPPTPVPASTPVPGATGPAVASLTIVHTNDMHGALAGDAVRVGAVQYESGGFANLSGYIDQARKEADGNVLVLDAGDIWQGTFASNETQGATMIEAMNLAGYDAVAAGNHDFDFSWQVLRDRAAQAKFPFLAANVVEDATGKIPPYLKPYIIKQVGGLKVGIIGVTYPGNASIIKKSAITGLTFLDGVQTIRQYLPEVRPQVDILVVLSHMGILADQDLAVRVQGIDVIVGGHTHIEQRATLKVGDTLIVQAGSKAKLIGRLRVDYDTRTKRIVNYTGAGELADVVSTKVTPNAQVAAVVQKRLDEAKAVINKPIGETRVDLEQCFEGECPLGNLVADAMLAAPAGDRPADVAMHNDSGLRARIPAGAITYGQLYEVLPFDNVLCAMDISGQDLLAILQRTTATRGGNLVVAGMTYTFEWAKPAGSRIVAVTVGGKPLDVNKTYRLQTIDYLATGGDSQDAFTHGKIITYGDPTVDVVADYIRKHSPVNPKAEGRITGR